MSGCQAYAYSASDAEPLGAVPIGEMTAVRSGAQSAFDIETTSTHAKFRLLGNGEAKRAQADVCTRCARRIRPSAATGC